MVEELLFYLVVFLTNTLHAITGFAGTMLATPLSVHLIGLDPSRVVLNLVAMAISVVILLKEYKLIQWDLLKFSCLYMIIGMVLGYSLYQIVDQTLLLRCYGVMMICVALGKIREKEPKEIPEIAMKFILIVAGIFQGLFSSGGPLLVVYLSTKINDKNVFRATTSTIWIILGTVFFFQNLNVTGTYELYLTATAMIPLAAGIALGTQILKKISQELFMKITSYLLLLSGIFACV